MRHLGSSIGVATAVALAMVVGWSVVSVPATAQAPAVTECRDWVDSADLDARFKVWACRDGNEATARTDISRLGPLIEEMWGPMTQGVPAGMGPPLPDARGTNVPAEYGGDPRIDFYLLQPGQGVFRGGRVRSISSTSAAAAGVSLGSGATQGTNAASGYVLVARDRLADEVAMRQDLIHEFFHVLEYAHNAYAPFPGDPPHWFTESSAVWAETYYLRDHSQVPHDWFRTFQASEVGLEDPDTDHQYAAYIWPYFMEQEAGKESIMRAWAALDALPSGSGLAAVTDAIDHELPFADHFRDFAVRNLNNDVLDETDPRETQYVDLDLGFPEGVPPGHIQSGSVSPGSPYVASQSIPALAGRYLDISLTDEARWVTISVAGLSPASAVDGDAIVHVVDGWWERRPLDGGILRFCRDDEDAYDDIDEVYLVVSNHDRQATVTGDVEASARDICSEDAIILEGTIRGTNSYHIDEPLADHYEAQATMNVTLVLTPHRATASGTATVSGEYTGDCRFADSESLPIDWDSQPDPDETYHPTEGRPGFALVQVYTSDPRFTERPLTGIYLSIGAGTSGEGGTCGYETGKTYPVTDVDFPMRVDLQGCMFFEVLNDEGTWHGECTEGDPPYERHWIANLEQVSPEPD